MPYQPASEALKDYLVLDLTRARAGPTAARQLADFGADVIKIETPDTIGGPNTGGDLGERYGPDFQNLHRNKRGLTLDLKAPEGLAIFIRLAEQADVVIENYRPNVKRRLGIDFDSLKKINPAIVYASISGFGQDGPYANRPGLDQIAQGMGGHMSVTGLPGGGPVRSGTAISDLTAGLLAAQGITTALLVREKTGRGQWLHTSLLEAQIFLMDFQAARWLVDQDVPDQAGNNHPTNVPMGTFKTKDGHVNIAPMPTMWNRFCKALDLSELEHHSDYATLPNRRINRDALLAEIEKTTVTRTTVDWVEHLNQAGVPCGPIYQMDQVFEDPQVKHLGIAQSVESGVRGPIEIIGQPIHLTETPSTLSRPSPEFGEHSDEILVEFGYGEEEIRKLKEEGVV